MIMGEHAVIYGQPCIVTAVDQRLEVKVERISGLRTRVHASQVKDTRFVDAALVKFFSTVGTSYTKSAISLSVRSQFSNTVGFGSSSAVTVATLKALCLLFDISVSNKQLFDFCFEIVTGVQGLGSGFDLAAGIFGGTMLFRKGGETIAPIVQRVPLVVGYSGVKADTVSLVRRVGELYKTYPEKTTRIFEAIGKLVLQGQEAIQKGEWQHLGTLMNFNQEYLRDLGVSTEKLESLISAAKSGGAYGAKLSGAGGGDCMIAVVSEETQKDVEHAIVQAGGQLMAVVTNAPGVRQETTDDQQELFVVVDKDDNVVGYKTRHECHHDKTLIHRAIGVVIFDDKGRVLLQKRSLTKDIDPGCWSTSVGGHVVKGEEYAYAAIREMKEELGIDVGVDQLEVISKKIDHYTEETEMGVLFRLIHVGPFQIHREEIDKVSFFEKSELALNVAAGKIQLTEAAKRNLQAIGFLP